MTLCQLPSSDDFYLFLSLSLCLAGTSPWWLLSLSLSLCVLQELARDYVHISKLMTVAQFWWLLSLSLSLCVLQELARDYVHISKHITFADFLCGIEPPVLSYDVESRSYKSTVPLCGGGTTSAPVKNQDQDTAEEQSLHTQNVWEHLLCLY